MERVEWGSFLASGQERIERIVKALAYDVLEFLLQTKQRSIENPERVVK